ncbi:M16 family metallopeptidase [Aquimarina agarivorans]|uniref:M16 family metallopeptidase n=1 Tax=Aquimarina agarivorans TaxID=980584 RepID=UPI000248EFD3|nr:insulinase family protein [Aquimarina agarivorans]
MGVLKKISRVVFIVIFITCFVNCKTKKEPVVYHSEQAFDITKSYKSFDNDPTGLRLYTLHNGLKVYLSKNTDEPKIETLIAVKAGSTYDPADQTGLAHYLEHMLFKGTSKLGTADWENERKQLREISHLYESHKNTVDTTRKKVIYRKIDSISGIAAKYAIANEYDKMISSIGAEGTNAFTSNEMTVYKNKIPANELDKWLAVEKERFSELVLRLFHTELETVYEEFNRGQDNDGRKQFTALLENLFPTHPYGTQTTIGTSEHLKNPSMKAIHNYFDTYYVPNNMALILVGDLDFDSTIRKIEKAFGSYVYKPVDHPEFVKELPIEKPITDTVYGPNAASIYIGFRTGSVNDDETIMVNLIDYLLANSSAGLIDLNLNSQQKVQSAGSFTSFKKDYGMHILYGVPKKEQSLDEVKELLLSQMELIKQGAFDDWLIGAVINDLTLSQIQSLESSKAVAYDFMYSFVYEQPWGKRLKKLEKLKKITKKQVIDFANKFYKENYVVVNKLVGEDPYQIKVENPEITPVDVNRDQVSEFTKKFNTMVSDSLLPQQIIYKDLIKETALSNGTKFSYIKNKTNDLASLTITFPVGSDHNKKLPIAFSYADFLGTHSLSNEALKKEFYKLGVKYNFDVQEEKTRMTISGLQQHIASGLQLLFSVIKDLKPDAEAYSKLIDRIEKSRTDRKKNKSDVLWKGMLNYSKYGEGSRLRNVTPIADLKMESTFELVQLVKGIIDYTPEFFYYGNDITGTKKVLEENYSVKDFKTVTSEKAIFSEKENVGNVYFVNYDMVQAELLLVSKSIEYEPKLAAGTLLFNTYFGSGLSSIVFQELRESKSLAYSAFSTYATATEQGKPNYLYAYMGTQANKLPEAIEAMKALLNDMPLNEAQFQSAKKSVLKTIAASRINKSAIYWNYKRLKKLGIDYDNRIEVYEAVNDFTLQDLNLFFQSYIKNKSFDMMVIGNKKDVDLDLLKAYGTVEELDIDYLFNF